MSDKEKFDNTAEWAAWGAREYLEEYFGKFSDDVKTTTKFVTDELKYFKDRPVSRVLDFGSGPTIIGVVGTVPYTAEIHIADYLAQNRKEIGLWHDNAPGAYDFRNTISFTLELEGIQKSNENIQKRTHELKSKIKEIMHCDALLDNPLFQKSFSYPLIISLYCADSATSSKQIWRTYMRNILSLLEPGGTIILTALRKCNFYTIGDARFPSANIDEGDLLDAFLANGFSRSNIRIDVAEVPGEVEQGFTGLLLARALKDA